MPKKLAKSQAPRPVSLRGYKPEGSRGPAVGAKAPAFRLPRDGGGMVELADFAKRKLVLYFYPRADTSGCTREAIDFSKLKSPFSRIVSLCLALKRSSAATGSAETPNISAPARHWHRTKLTKCSKRMAYGQQKTLYGR